MDEKHAAVVFARDPDLEMAAHNLLGMPPEEVKRTRLPDLRALLHEHGATVPGEAHAADAADAATLALPTPRPKSVPVRAAALAPALAGSEINLLPTHDPAEPLAPVVTSMNTLTVAEDDAALQGLEYLTVPINVQEWCNRADGLAKLSRHVHHVLGYTTQVEQAVRGKRQAVALHQQIWDEEERAMVEATVGTDAKVMSALVQWLQALVDDLDKLIRMRLEAQNGLQSIPRGNTAKLCEKLHQKTTKMKMLFTVVASRLQCLQLPTVRAVHPATTPQAAQAAQPAGPAAP